MARDLHLLASRLWWGCSVQFWVIFSIALCDAIWQKPSMYGLHRTSILQSHVQCTCAVWPVLG